MHEEAKLQKWMIENEHKTFSIKNYEISLMQAYELLERETAHSLSIKPKRKIKSFGRVDIIMLYGSTLYSCEIKFYPFSNGEFWDAMKILGYTAYLNWQSNCKYVPAIIMPMEKIKLEHFMTANMVKITLFGVKKIKEGEYTLEKAQPKSYRELI